MKIFDIIFSSSPFIHSGRSTKKMYQEYLGLIYCLCFFAVICYGYAALKIFTLVLGVSFIFIWCYQFVDKRFFLNSSMWQITVLIYALLLMPTTPWYEVVLGISVLFLLGISLFYINKQYIFNPILLGMLAIIVIDSYNTPSHISWSLDELYQMIAHENAQWGNRFIGTTLLDLYHIIAGAVEKTYFYQYNPKFISEILPHSSYYRYIDNLQIPSWKWNNFFITHDNLSLGTSSLFLIIISYIFLSLRRIISSYISILYVIIYASLNLILMIFNEKSLSIDAYFFSFFDAMTWFTAVFLVTDNRSLPMNKKGRIFFVIIAAGCSFILQLYGCRKINHIIALLISNLIVSLCEILGKSRIFGKENRLKISKKELVELFIDNKKKYIITTIIGLIMAFIIFLSSLWMSNDFFVSRKEELYYQFVRDFFPKYIINKKEEHDVYSVRSLSGKENAVMVFDTIQEHRIKVLLGVLINNNIISDIKIRNISGEYFSLLEQDVEQQIIEMHIDELPNRIDWQLSDQSKEMSFSSSIKLRLFLKSLNDIKKKYLFSVN